jgi:23S rRNA pseudouridine2605 synthase
MPEKTTDDKPGERIAKVIARAGLASRREAEAWIAAGRIAVNGKVIKSPALNVGASDRITVDGQPLPQRSRTRLFRYHKPRGLVTTHSDPQARPTIFGALPKRLPRLISVGRLDLNSEGLLLLTNDGGLARALELPATGWLRRYRVRALGRVTQEALDHLRSGITIAGVRYGPIEATLDREQGANVWLTMGLREGKNREVRKVLEQLGLTVNRLIRVAYGPFELGELDDGAVEEVETAELRKVLGPELAKQANADFESPLEDEAPPPRHSGAGRRPELGTQKRGRHFDRKTGAMDSGPRANARDRNDKKKKCHRRDRSGGPRPSRPRA